MAVTGVPATAAGGEVGPYRALQLLGRGAFGEVLLAEDTRQPGHVVALKVANCSELDLDATSKARDDVLREASFLRRLRHPHVVRCEEALVDERLRVVWLALEMMDGGSLRNLIESRRNTIGQPFDASFVRRVLAEIGSALEYIHSEGVIHRDVKPANILLTLTAPPILKLADFGISKLLEATGLAQSIVGTQHYFSPELAAGSPYGFASDTWALGVCLFELLTLQRPFTANNPFALACRICNQPPSELPPSVAQDLAEVITGFLQKDPQLRLALRSALAVSAEVADLVPCVDRHELCEIDRGSPVSALGCAAEELDEDRPSPRHVHGLHPHAPAVAFEAPAEGKAAGERRRWQKKDKEKGTGNSWWASLASALIPSALTKSAAESQKEHTIVKTFSSGKLSDDDVECNLEETGSNATKLLRETPRIPEHLPGEPEELPGSFPELLS